jgi:hypothetical protein
MINTPSWPPVVNHVVHYNAAKEAGTPCAPRPARSEAEVVASQIDTVHFGLLALHHEMCARYAALDSLTGEPTDQPEVTVVVDDIAQLRRQLAQLWHQISTELQPRTSPALHALERLQLHGNAVGIHLTTIPSAHADAHPAQSDIPAGGERAEPDRRCGTATRRAA